jgi:hypothetical protein
METIAQISLGAFAIACVGAAISFLTCITFTLILAVSALTSRPSTFGKKAKKAGVIGGYFIFAAVFVGLVGGGTWRYLVWP